MVTVDRVLGLASSTGWAPPLASAGSNGCAQHGAKLSVMLYVPLATHGFTAGFAAFGIEQNPFPPSS